jgi:ribosomal protein L11 methyltransferase
MDPGLSFGTGQHPTTAYCLTRIVESYKSGKAKSFLDIGTGSGILAIAAAKLGFNPVVAIDNDAEAVAKAAENALSNSVNSAISFSCNNLSAWKPRRRFDLVCANLQSDLLIQEAKLIRQSVAHQGLLVVAGILASQFEDVQETYRKLGLDLIESVTSGEWRSGLLGSPL